MFKSLQGKLEQCNIDDDVEQPNCSDPPPAKKVKKDVDLATTELQSRKIRLSIAIRQHNDGG